MTNQTSQPTRPGADRDWIFLGAMLAVLLMVPAGLTPTGAPEPDTQLERSVVFGSGKGHHPTIELSGGGVLALFGSNDVDLSQAAIQGPVAVIRANALMGKVDIRVPKDWEVRVAGVPFAGRYSDMTHTTSDRTAGPRPTLIVEGQAILGSVTVRN